MRTPTSPSNEYWRGWRSHGPRNGRAVQEVWKGMESLQYSLDGEVGVLMALHDEQVQIVSRLQRDFDTFFGKVSSELGNDSCLSPACVPDAMAADSDSPRMLEVKAVEPTLNDTDVSCSFLPSRALKPSKRQVFAERLEHERFLTNSSRNTTRWCRGCDFLATLFCLSCEIAHVDSFRNAREEGW